MSLKSRRSPPPNEHYDKNGNDSSSAKNRLIESVMASNNSFSKRLNIVTILMTIGLLITLFNFYGLKRLENDRFDSLQYSVHQLIKPQNGINCQKEDNRPVVWVAAQRVETGYLTHIIEAFDKLGYRIIYNGTDEEWDVLWSHDYPFMRGFLPPLKKHQRINHFPGSGFITNKVNLATSGLQHIPLAFNLPAEKDKFLEHAKQNPDKLWVQKDNNHRGIRVLDLDQLKLDASGTFVQEYIKKPFLIDGKKFDIGLYVTMTSINPLRVYILGNEALLRFCAKKYHPFNSTDLNSYVVADDYTPIWQMPSLRKYFIDLNLNMKETLNSYIRTLGKDPNFVWKQIEDSIKTVYYTKEAEMLRLTNNYESTRNFFEMVRFDFALDEDLNVYLMEANMSPNLSSSHFAPNKQLYEQVIFNLLSLVGLTQTLNIKTWPERHPDHYNMAVSSKDLSVHEELCSNAECHLSCKSKECDVCYHCLKGNQKIVLKDAIYEQNSKWNIKRLIPSTTDKETDLMKSNTNSHHRKWFIGKCQQNKIWCN